MPESIALHSLDSGMRWNDEQRINQKFLGVCIRNPLCCACLHMYTKSNIYAQMNILPEQFFKILADPTRLRVLVLLAGEGELCVCELTHALDEVQPKISRHLGLLREAGVVLDRRQGQWIYYRLNPGLPDWAQRVLEATAAGVAGQRSFAADKRALSRMPNRPGKACCA
jgi:ArsR family transcriptional regulator